MVALALLLLVFLAIGKWYPGTGAEVLDWQPTRSYEDEIRLEIEDIDEMLEASNERRRRTGRPELTEDQVRLEVERDLLDQQARQDEFKDELWRACWSWARPAAPVSSRRRGTWSRRRTASTRTGSSRSPRGSRA
jgi:hypothetical protein